MIYQKIEDGDFHNVNLKSKFASLLISYLQNVINENSAKWLYFARYSVGLSLREYNPNLFSIYQPNSE